MSNEKPQWDTETKRLYNESQVHLWQFQRRQKIVTSPEQFITWAKVFECVAHRDIEGLREEVERLAKEILDEEEPEYGFIEQRPEPKEWR